MSIATIWQTLFTYFFFIFHLPIFIFLVISQRKEKVQIDKSGISSKQPVVINFRTCITRKYRKTNIHIENIEQEFDKRLVCGMFVCVWSVVILRVNTLSENLCKYKWLLCFIYFFYMKTWQLSWKKTCKLEVKKEKKEN